MKALETSQKKVEARNFEIRKNLLKYDDVMNDQRKAVFEQRREFMAGDDVDEVVRYMRQQVAEDMVAKHIPPKAYAEQWDMDGLDEQSKRVFGLDLPVKDWAAEEGMADEEVLERLGQAVDRAYADKAVAIGPEMMRRVEKQILLQTIDMDWREHLQQLDALRSVIGLRGYAQRDPLNEFKTEAFTLFEDLIANLREKVTQVLMTIRIAEGPPPDMQPQVPQQTRETHLDPRTGQNEAGPGGSAAIGPLSRQRRATEINPADPATWGKVPRNTPCPCGSGKKYKHCHGQMGGGLA